MALLLNLKAKLIAAGAALLAIFGFLVRLKIVTSQRDKAKHKAEQYKAWTERQTETAEIESELEQEFSHRAQEANEDVKEGKVPDHLSNPHDF